MYTHIHIGLSAVNLWRRNFVVAVAALAGMAANAGTPALMVPSEIHAAPGVECNVYYHTITDAIKPDRYGYDAQCNVGKSLGDRWAWTPTAADAGRRESLVLRMWDDEHGMFNAVTTTVSVAKDGDKGRVVTIALLGDSIANNNYQDRILMRMREAGFANYRPVGSRTGSSAAPVGQHEEGRAAHDCYGGYGFAALLTSYKFSVEELDNTHAEAEREQLMKLGVVKIESSWAWRRNLLKSPLLSYSGGKVQVDVQGWFDRINGGKAPDVIMISTGSGDMCGADPLPGGVEKVLGERTIFWARKLLAALRAAAPDALIVLEKPPSGSNDDYPFGKAYNTVTGFGFRRNMHALYRAYDKLVKELGDPKIVTVAGYMNVDPVAGYPRKLEPFNRCSEETQLRCANALHQSPAGGAQYGDAVYAELRHLLFE